MKLTIFKAAIASLLLTIFLLTNSSAQSINNFRLKDKLSTNSLTAASDKTDELTGKTEKSVIQTVPLKHTNLLSELNSSSEKQFSSVFENTQKKKKKSVGLGILFSALVPGTGELYGESYLKAGIFFAVELLAWGTYFYFENKGDNKTDEYYAYAEKYWSVNTYAQWLVDMGFPESGQINPNEQNRAVLEEQIRICERRNFSHTLPIYQSQQYYELIGKYQNFQAGWTNLEHRPDNTAGSPYNYQTYHDPIFTAYANERQKANDFYDYAKIGPVTAIINHVLSAADAAWVISSYNNKIKVQTGFRMENRISPYTYEYKQIPTFNVSVGF